MRGLLDTPRTGPSQSHRVDLRAADGAALLADWLGELAYLAETTGFVPGRIGALELGYTELTARVEGFTGEPAHLVKGATYHRLSLEPVAAGWRATVVLDV